MGKGEKHSDEAKDTLTVQLPVKLRARVPAHAHAVGVEELSQVVRRALDYYLDSPPAQLSMLEKQIADLDRPFKQHESRSSTESWSRDKRIARLEEAAALK